MTELVTNSVRHTAADSLTLSVAIGKSAVLTEVADTGPGFDPKCVEHSGDEDTGWGLFLVQRLADKWGVRHDGPRQARLVRAAPRLEAELLALGLRRRLAE